ncbi:hypothetical protein [Enterovirga sp.]|jgi:nucleoside-specific outer membrane channel protein Tsx|uniref:hypothetical protein n=1 Tax=Enterovirga sp. TaxID=2026350 RepID=UPI002620AB3D|nr:hypothetical protein [Enterovirga sp.]MDB5592699.1 hypothetical protein [Enterovirga sp.]
MMHLTFTTLLAAGLALAAASSAQAQSMSQQEQAEFKKNCTQDYSRLCSAFAPNSPEVRQCFQQKIGQVSARCQKTIAGFKR